MEKGLITETRNPENRMETASTAVRKIAVDRHPIVKTATKNAGRTRAKGKARMMEGRDRGSEVGMEVGIGDETPAATERIRAEMIVETERRMRAESGDEAGAEALKGGAVVAAIVEIAALKGVGETM